METKKLHAIGVRRDDRFSPNSVEKDRLILQAVGLHFPGGMPLIDEADLTEAVEADVIFSMARLPRTLAVLHRLEQRGVRVINTPQSVENCMRSTIEQTIRHNGIPAPGPDGAHGYWLKRGDAAAQSKGDVVYCENRAALAAAQADFALRGVTDWVVSAHVPGDIVKFYGVKGGLFRYFYPGDDGISKFGAEVVNGPAHHYPFAADRLRATVETLAAIVGIEVYGGDAVIDAEGHFYIIDFNDWPGFSRCRAEAAAAIANLACRHNK